MLKSLWNIYWMTYIKNIWTVNEKIESNRPTVYLTAVFGVCWMLIDASVNVALPCVDSNWRDAEDSWLSDETITFPLVLPVPPLISATWAVEEMSPVLVIVDTISSWFSLVVVTMTLTELWEWPSLAVAWVEHPTVVVLVIPYISV